MRFINKHSQDIKPQKKRVDSKSIIEKVRSTINNEQAAANQRTMKALEIAADVQKSRINAVASVARAYYSRRVVNYNIVRIY